MDEATTTTVATTVPPTNPDPMVDPLYLHGSEQPDLVLVTDKLTITNYNDWSKAMHNALGAKNKLGFVDGTLAEPQLTTEQPGPGTETMLWCSPKSSKPSNLASGRPSCQSKQRQRPGEALGLDMAKVT
ncbi:unnamed protein product [Linum trigynum]|uniref:Retrotransposon Copia-like N-terminal domain-containing protein n=1 Tax=Linum trigynum TaxID=586398 RepID=A0AAV2DVV3_9ROSI